MRKRTPTDIATAEAFRLPDAARLCSVGEQVLRHAIRDGCLEASKLGNSPRSPVVVTRAALSRWLDARRIHVDKAAA